MNALQFRVRNMSKKDIPQVLDICKLEEWDSSNYCFYTWIEVDPDGFKVAVTDLEKVLGICCAMKNYQNLYIIGYYIVRKEYRGMGIGSSLWKACWEYVGSKNCGLNAMPGTTELYRDKFGFSVTDEQWCILYNSTTEDIIHPENLSDVIPEGVSIIPFNESHLPFIFKYDFDLCGYVRKLLLELSFKEKDSHTLVAFKDGICVGFGSVKRSTQDIPQICPLYAEDPIVAETMLRRLLSSCTLKKGFSMETYSNNQVANNFIKKLGCPIKYKLTRMYRYKPEFSDPTQRVFAIFDSNCVAV